MNFILSIARMVTPHLMRDLRTQILKRQNGWNFIPFTIHHLLSTVSCERNGRQQTTLPPKRTLNRPWNKLHRRTFTISPLVINLLRWKMNEVHPLCWNTGQHTDNTQETCVKPAWRMYVSPHLADNQQPAQTVKAWNLLLKKHLLWVWNYDEMGIFW